MKALLFVYLTLSTALLSSYNFKFQDDTKKIEYARCIKHVKNKCKILSESHVHNLIKTCKLLVIHSHDVDQIKNSNSCLRKEK